MALLLHQMDITVGVFSFVRVPNGQKVKIFFSQHHHMIFRGQMQNLPTSVIIKKIRCVFTRRKCGHSNNSRPHTRKVSFISHLVAFMYLESTENCAYGPLFKNCYCLDVLKSNSFLGVTYNPKIYK